MPQPAPVVFFDIAGESSADLTAFYSEIFGWDIAPDGRFTASVNAPAEGGVAALSATIRQDPAEKRLYLGVPDIAATLDQVAEKGGTVDVPRFEVPGMVVLGLFKDPAGNPMGLVELDGDAVKIP